MPKNRKKKKSYLRTETPQANDSQALVSIDYIHQDVELVVFDMKTPLLMAQEQEAPENPRAVFRCMLTQILSESNHERSEKIVREAISRVNQLRDLGYSQQDFLQDWMSALQELIKERENRLCWIRLPRSFRILVEPFLPKFENQRLFYQTIFSGHYEEIRPLYEMALWLYVDFEFSLEVILDEQEFYNLFHLLLRYPLDYADGVTAISILRETAETRSRQDSERLLEATKKAYSLFWDNHYYAQAASLLGGRFRLNTPLLNNDVITTPYHLLAKASLDPHQSHIFAPHAERFYGERPSHVFDNMDVPKDHDNLSPIQYALKLSLEDAQFSFYVNEWTINPIQFRQLVGQSPSEWVELMKTLSLNSGVGPNRKNILYQNNGWMSQYVYANIHYFIRNNRSNTPWLSERQLNELLFYNLYSLNFQIPQPVLIALLTILKKGYEQQQHPAFPSSYLLSDVERPNRGDLGDWLLSQEGDWSELIIFLCRWEEEWREIPGRKSDVDEEETLFIRHSLSNAPIQRLFRQFEHRLLKNLITVLRHDPRLKKNPLLLFDYSFTGTKKNEGSKLWQLCLKAANERSDEWGIFTNFLDESVKKSLNLYQKKRIQAMTMDFFERIATDIVSMLPEFSPLRCDLLLVLHHNGWPYEALMNVRDEDDYRIGHSVLHELITVIADWSEEKMRDYLTIRFNRLACCGVDLFMMDHREQTLLRYLYRREQEKQFLTKTAFKNWIDRALLIIDQDSRFAHHRIDVGSRGDLERCISFFVAEDLMDTLKKHLDSNLVTDFTFREENRFKNLKKLVHKTHHPVNLTFRKNKHGKTVAEDVASRFNIFLRPYEKKDDIELSEIQKKKLSVIREAQQGMASLIERSKTNPRFLTLSAKAISGFTSLFLTLLVITYGLSEAAEDHHDNPNDFLKPKLIIHGILALLSIFFITLGPEGSHLCENLSEDYDPKQYLRLLGRFCGTRLLGRQSKAAWGWSIPFLFFFLGNVATAIGAASGSISQLFDADDDAGNPAHWAYAPAALMGLFYAIGLVYLHSKSYYGLQGLRQPHAQENEVTPVFLELNENKMQWDWLLAILGGVASSVQALTLVAFTRVFQEDHEKINWSEPLDILLLVGLLGYLGVSFCVGYRGFRAHSLRKGLQGCSDTFREFWTITTYPLAGNPDKRLGILQPLTADDILCLLNTRWTEFRAQLLRDTVVNNEKYRAYFRKTRLVPPPPESTTSAEEHKEGDKQEAPETVEYIPSPAQYEETITDMLISEELSPSALRLYAELRKQPLKIFEKTASNSVNTLELLCESDASNIDSALILLRDHQGYHLLRSLKSGRYDAGFYRDRLCRKMELYGSIVSQTVLANVPAGLYLWLFTFRYGSVALNEMVDWLTIPHEVQSGLFPTLLSILMGVDSIVYSTITMRYAHEWVQKRHDQKNQIDRQAAIARGVCSLDRNPHQFFSTNDSEAENHHNPIQTPTVSVV